MNKLTPLRTLSVLAGAIAAVFSLAVSAHDDRHDDRWDGNGHESQIRRGFEIVPPGVKLNLMGKNRALVGLGSYIVNTSGCIDCHSHPTYAPGGDPFLGQPEVINANQYLSGGRQFGPTITSANITPDYAGKPAGLTRAEFIQMLRTGHNPKDPPGQIVQVMPWPVFGKKTDRDLNAIYEYLRAIPSLPDNPNPGP
ncbi:hypothetical protein Q4S45_09705 [Massilia sp. R2A-15]|uniref:hypothetical protein n=1 Tax=Massilia sp. R2A-15 TaxID=3064278 RepID=UPI002734C734|nr:hypothetical protein [Massilia sp. R2A-15]WLI91372.1 hypothetical protein Q4S45_09705 [Massilia sp. R2A-15]